MQRDFEMTDTTSHEFLNPIGQGKTFSLSDDEIKQDYLAQKPLPWRKKVHKFDPEFFKCDNKIVKFNHSQLGDFRALVSFSHTIVSDSNTWKHLNLLTIVCFITMAVVYFSQSYRSVNDSSNVSSRIQTLISFVFASYISLVISRWDRIRNTTLGMLFPSFGPLTVVILSVSAGQQWGSLENLVFTAIKIVRKRTKERTNQIKASLASIADRSPSEEQVAEIRRLNEALEQLADEEQLLVNRIIRYARLSMVLTFRAAQSSEDFSLLEELKLLSADEERWLRAAAIGTRPLMVVSWISEYFEELLPSKGCEVNDVAMSLIASNTLSLR